MMALMGGTALYKIKQLFGIFLFLIFAYDFLIFWYLFESSVLESHNIRVYFYLDDI
jgi:hypothetical protein